MNAKKPGSIALALAALALGLAVQARSAEVKRVPFTKEEAARPENPAQAAKMVSVDNLVFPSGVYGTKPDPLDQVEEVIETMHARLAEQGLGIGNMLQHTIFVKDGAVSPGAVLDRFHKTATRLAPSLKTLRSVGTIIRVPQMPGTGAVMLDIVAGKPLAQGADDDGYKRVPFVYGPQEIAETVTGGRFMFTAGLEAMDFRNGTLPKTLDEQVTAVVDKLEQAFKGAGLSLTQMVQHNIYYKVGSDAAAIVEKFHAEIGKREPFHKKYPGVGAMMGVNGMAAPGFLLEMDAVGTTAKPEEIKGAPYTEVPMDVNKTATVAGLSHIVDVVGVEYANDMAYKDGLEGQIDLTVRNLRDFMRAGGLELKDLVKVRLMVKKGAGDAARVRAEFYEALSRLAPELKAHPPAETLIYVEKLDRELVFQVVPVSAK
ncbi:MAG TPA: Rid family hydrolase [Candidatus Aminicenantes bacterium]|nr:Rid family hydrolase [Candidatus Aminicenantes bacterium]